MKTLVFMIFFFLYGLQLQAQTTFWSESFETDGNGSRYTPEREVSPTDAGAGCNDYFFRSPAVDNCSGDDTDIFMGAYTNLEGNFLWVCEDLDDGGVGGSGNWEQFIDFTNIPSIAGKNNLAFRGRFAAGNTTAYDNNTSATTNPDFMVVEYQIDGGGFMPVIDIHPQLTIAGLFNTQMALDTNGDNLGDSPVLTTTLQEFIAVIPGTGSTLDLRIRVSVNSGNEELAFDFFELLEDYVPLPVELISFTSETKEKSVFLNWETAQEIDNYGFEIEHSSDQRNWEVLSFFPGSEHPEQGTKYSFTHQTPKPGLNYYRLRQVDLDGSVSYSEIRIVKIEQEETVDIFPNPSSGEIHISGIPEGKYKIISMQGKTLREGVVNELTSLSLSELNKGFYYIHLQSKNQFHIKKVILF